MAHARGLVVALQAARRRGAASATCRASPPSPSRSGGAAAPRVNAGRPKVILWPDTFNNYFHPADLHRRRRGARGRGLRGDRARGVALLRAAALRLRHARPRQEAAAPDRSTTLRREIEAGVPVVGLEPSCVAVFRDEMCNLLPQDQDARRLAQQTFLLSEFLARPRLASAASARAQGVRPRPLPPQGACSTFDKEQSLVGKTRPATSRCSTPAAAAWPAPSATRREHYDVSQKCGERVLLPAVRDADKTRGHRHRRVLLPRAGAAGTDRTPLHFAELCKMALDEHGSASNDEYPERGYVTPTQPASGKLLYVLALLVIAIVIGVIVAAP